MCHDVRPSFVCGCPVSTRPAKPECQRQQGGGNDLTPVPQAAPDSTVKLPPPDELLVEVARKTDVDQVELHGPVEELGGRARRIE